MSKTEFVEAAANNDLHRIKQIKCLLNINNYKKLDILQAKKTPCY